MHMKCSACDHGKEGTRPHKPIHRLPSHNGHNVSSNTTGPIKPKSKIGNKHILTFFDLLSRYAISIPLHTRADVLSAVVTTIQTIHNHTKRINNRYNSKQCQCIINEKSPFDLNIKRVNSNDHNHRPPRESKLMEEKFNRTIMNAARCALDH